MCERRSHAARNAFKAYYKRAGEFRNTYASTLDAQFKQLKFFADARHYNSHAQGVP